MKRILLILLLIISPLAFCQWEIITPTYEGFDDSYKEIHFINKDTGFVVVAIAEMGYETVLLRTTDGAETWDTIRKSDIGVISTTNFLSIDFVNDTLGYIACVGDILKTEDAGESWYSLDTADVLDVAVGWYNILFVNVDTGYIAYQDGGAQCLRTFDGGWTWEPDPVMTGVRNFNEHNGIITGCTGGWATLDLETLVWTKGQGLLDNEDIPGLNFYHSISNNGQLILTGSKSGAGGGMYAVSEDDGETWKLYDFSSIIYIAEVQFKTDELGFAAGAFPGAMRTWDGGDTWFLVETDNHDSEMSKRFQEFDMIDENVGYAISLDGIYKTTNGGGALLSEVSSYEYTSIEELALNEISIYPNPVHDFINFDSFDIQVEKIQVFDMTGLLVFEDEIKSNKINVSKLSAGQYIVRVFAEKAIYSAQIIKAD